MDLIWHAGTITLLIGLAMWATLAIVCVVCIEINKAVRAIKISTVNHPSKGVVAKAKAVLKKDGITCAVCDNHSHFCLVCDHTYYDAHTAGEVYHGVCGFCTQIISTGAAKAADPSLRWRGDLSVYDMYIWQCYTLKRFRDANEGWKSRNKASA